MDVGLIAILSSFVAVWAGLRCCYLTLMTSVTCGPRCPRATCNSSVSPGCRVLTPMPASAVTWRKASPDPSESWTKPYPLLGLNHLTCPRTTRPDDSSNSGSASRGRDVGIAPRLSRIIFLEDQRLVLKTISASLLDEAPN